MNVLDSLTKFKCQIIMKYLVDKNEKYTVFTLQSENLNAKNAPSLKTQFVILKDEGVKNLILNLANVRYVDSSGLSAILVANRLWGENGSFVLTGVDHENVSKLIEISRLNSVLCISGNVNESIDGILLDELERELNSGVDGSE